MLTTSSWKTKTIWKKDFFFTLKELFLFNATEFYSCKSNQFIRSSTRVKVKKSLYLLDQFLFFIYLSLKRLKYFLYKSSP